MRSYVSVSIATIIAVLVSISYAQAAANPCSYSWARTLKIGSVGADVQQLQQFLNSDPATQIASAGPGSPGNEVARFGNLTAIAVKKFQEKYAIDILAPVGLSKGTGIVGPSMRAKLNTLCSASSSATPKTGAEVAGLPSVASADALTLSDPGQSPASIAPAGAGVNFLSFTLTAGSKDVIVRSVTVKRIGAGNDGAFAAIALNDPNGLQIGNQYPFSSDHTVAFRTPFTVPAGTSETFLVVGYMEPDLSGFEGQAPALQIEAIDASSPLQGALPLRGTMQTINSTLQIGGATAMLSPLDPGGAQTHYINDKSVRFSAFRVTANSQEDLTLSYMIWQQSGSASSNDISHVVTVVNGTSVPALVQPDGHTYVSLFNPAIVIPKGQSADISVQGDIASSGANRTVEFDLYDNTDDEGFGGALYGFGVGVIPSGNTALSGSHAAFITSDGTTDGTTGTPFFAGSVITISPGALISVGR